jgi:hypothetical protein
MLFHREDLGMKTRLLAIFPFVVGLALIATMFGLPSAAQSQVTNFGSAGALVTDSPGLVNPAQIDANDDTVEWVQLYPADQPSPRTEFAMAYDSGRGRVVLFGGYSAS